MLWGAWVIIPSVGRPEVLKQLHQCHPGVSRMKALARSYVWWPKLDQDVERLVKTCRMCQEHRNVPAVAPLHPWNWPEKPWQRKHVDYAGPFMRKMFLVLFGAHSTCIQWIPLHLLPPLNVCGIVSVIMDYLNWLYQIMVLASLVPNSKSSWIKMECNMLLLHLSMLLVMV